MKTPNPSTFHLAILTIHVITGVLTTVGLYALWLEFLKKNPGIRWLRTTAWGTAILAFISWVSSGWYYVVVYGASVKPVIKAGPFPWAHLVIMESKEHLFLFLPIIALGLAIGSCWINKDSLLDQPALKKSLIFLSGTATIVGILVTLMGVLISGAVRG